MIKPPTDEEFEAAIFEMMELNDRYGGRAVFQHTMRAFRKNRREGERLATKFLTTLQSDAKAKGLKIEEYYRTLSPETKQTLRTIFEEYDLT